MARYYFGDPLFILETNDAWVRFCELAKLEQGLWDFEILKAKEGYEYEFEILEDTSRRTETLETSSGFLVLAKEGCKLWDGKNLTQAVTFGYVFEFKEMRISISDDQGCIFARNAPSEKWSLVGKLDLEGQDSLLNI